MAKLHQQITLPDGRVLGYACYGDPKGSPLVYLHGFPASRLEGAILDIEASRLGVSVIAPDRPGFGLSDFQPGRTILDWAEDVLHLANKLHLDRFSLVGGSGGCPYALACAYRLPQRIIRAGVIAGLGPTLERESTRQMSGAARLGFSLARHVPLLFSLLYGALALLLARYPALIFSLNEVTGPDRDVLDRPEVRAALTDSVQEALRPGPKGAIHELKLLSRPWGFRLEDISTPLDIWHGLEDGTVPVSMAQSMERRIPNAKLRLLPDEAHISLPVRHGADILGVLCLS